MTEIATAAISARAAIHHHPRPIRRENTTSCVPAGTGTLPARLDALCPLCSGTGVRPPAPLQRPGGRHLHALPRARCGDHHHEQARRSAPDRRHLDLGVYRQDQPGDRGDPFPAPVASHECQRPKRQADPTCQAADPGDGGFHQRDPPLDPRRNKRWRKLQPKR